MSIGNAWGQTTYAAYLAEGFEGSTTLSGNSCTAANNNVTANTTARTGSKVCYAYPSSASSTARYIGVGSNLTAPKTHYIHAIVWVKGDNVADGKVQHQIGPYGTGPATAYVNTTTSYTRCTITPYQSGGSAKQVRLYFISNNGTPVAHFWYDDFIMYTSSANVPTDLDKPSKATSASATINAISWTKGNDTGEGATGIQNTLIWKRTGGSSNDLTLNDQGIYSLTSTVGPSTDQSGHWTLISATVDANATSYSPTSGTFAEGDVYAIVHRDLAYNYSEPTYVQIPSSGSGATKYDVNIGAMSNGSVTASPTSQEEGENVTLTVSPSAGYELSGDVTVTGDESGDGITATDNGDGTWTFEMPAEDVTVAASFSLFDYSVSKTLTNCAVKEGSTAIPATMNYGDDLSTIIEPTSGYLLPSSITVSGVTSYTWNASTGALTLTDVTGNVSISIVGETPQTGTGATVTYAMVTSGSTAATYSAGAFSNVLSSATPNKNTLTASSTMSGGNGVDVKSGKTTANGTYTAGITSSSSAYNDASTPYVQFSFDVLDGYTFTPTGISVPIQPISNAAYFKILVTDGSSTWTTTSSSCSAGSLTTITTAPTGGSALSGTVNVKVYCYSQSSATGYRFKTPITITGTVATPASGYTVTYNGSGTIGEGTGSGTVPTDGTSYSSGATVTVLDITDLGFEVDDCEATFMGWNTDTDMHSGTHYNPGATFNISANTTLYAVWGYDISYYEQDGTTPVDGMAPTSYIYTVGATLPTPSKTGYTGEWYNAWCVEAGCSSDPCGYVDKCKRTEVSNSDYCDAAYYVMWTAKEYTVTLNDNGGNSDGSGSVTLTYNSASHAAITNPTKDGFTFDGWYSEEGGTGTLIIDAAGALQANTAYTGAAGIWTNDAAVTLYAKWSSTSTKRVYMKCGSTWCDDVDEQAPKFFTHSWDGSTTANSTVMQHPSACETDVYYADIPASHTYIIFTRQKAGSTELVWSGDNFVNQSVDIEIGANNLFTCTGWSDGKGAFSGSTYAAPTYTISFAGNGNTDGSMSDISSLACGANQALTANAFEKAGYSFANWIANVAVTIGGETVSAGSAIANEATIQNISSDITFTAQWTQEVPTSATVNSDSWRYFPGQTISLTATPTGGTSDFTYQWQKYVGEDTWSNLANGEDATDGGTFTGVTTNNLQISGCTKSNSGSYRCVVSKLGGSVASGGYDVHVFTLEGDYSGGSDWTAYDITYTSGTAGTVAVTLNASSLFEFGIKDNFNNEWYRNTNFIIDNWTNEHFEKGSGNCRLFTGPAGNYTFTVDINHAGDNYVEVSLAYPSVSHPAAGYAYFKKWNDWAGYYIHWWYNDGSDHPLTEWGSDVHITNETTICGTDYIYFPVIANYNQLKIKDAAGDGSHYTGDLSSVGSSGKYFDFTNDNAWNAFPAYTVTFNSNGGSAVAEQNVGCGETATEPTAPTRLNYDFEGWQLAGVDYDFATIVDDDITLDAVWTRKAISGSEEDIVIIDGTTVNTGGTLSVGHYFSAGTANSHVKYAGAIGGGNGCRFTTFTLPAGSSAVVKEAIVYTAKTFVIIPSSQVSGIDFENNTSSGCTISYADPYFSLTGGSGGKNQTEASVSTTIPAGTYYCGSTGSGLEIGKLTLTVTTSAPSVKLKVLGSVTQTITITVGEKLGDIFASGSLPTPVLPEGYTFKGWKNEANDAAVDNNTVTTGSMVIYADVDAPASTDATLSALTVNGDAATVDALDPTKYTFTLPFGTTAVPTVVATPTDANAVATVTANTLSGATIEVVPETGEDDKVTYTITYSIVASKDIRMVWKKEGNPCGESSVPADIILSTNDLVKDYLAISFVQTTETAANQAEEKSGSYLSTGKSIGNLVKITAKPGYAFKNMSFYGKIETDEIQCPVSIDGGETWTNVTGSLGSNGQHCDVFTNAEAHEIILKNNAGAGTWIRHMDLTIINACTPKTIAWTAEPAAEYELGSSPDAIAASANNGTVTYASNDDDVIAVNESTGALTLKALGTVTLSASVPAGDGVTYCDEGAQISKANIATYYLVTFNAQNGTPVTTTKYYKNDAAIALPATPVYAGFNFLGWFDAAEGGNAVTSAITPTASRTIYAHWEAQCAGPTITVQPASAEYKTGRAAAALACTATAGAAGELTYSWYSCDDAERTNPVLLAGAPTPSTAVAGTFYYYCTVQEAECDVVRTSDVIVITVTEKDPVCIIKATPTSGAEATADGAYKGNAYFKGRNDDKKLNSQYDYVGVELMVGKSFLATDKVVLNQTADISGNDITKFYVYTETPASGKTYVTVDNPSPVKGDNWFEMPAELVGESALYIGRVDDKCNPTVGYLAVYRVMNPILTAITINGSAGELDELEENTFNVTIPYDANLESLTVVPTIIRNAAHATTPQAVISNDGAWVIGDNTYRVMDKDGDYTDYIIALTRDAAVESVSVSGETTVAAKSQITLTATVLPAEVSNKAVTWSSSDETKATVDANGVVTGKAAGSVTITATSVADGTKKGTLDVTVTKFVGTERVYWFAYADDAAANDVSNNSTVFGSAPTGSSSGARIVTLEEEWVVNTTKYYSGAPGSTGTFVVPAEYTATFYAAAKASGNGGRYIQLKQGDVVKYTSNEFEGNDPQVVKIEGVAAGTYTIAYVGGMSNFYMYAAELNSYPLTSVALEEGFNLRLEQSRTPVFTITPAKAAVASQVWSEVSRTGASDATLNTSTGEITAGTEEGTLTVKVTVTDAFENEVESGNCVVKIVNIIDQKDVTGSMTWNWTGAGTASVTIDNEEALVLGNYIDGDQWAYLKGTNGDQAYHHESSYGSYQGKGTLSFKTTVPGLVTITARRWSNATDLKIGEDVILSLEGSNKTSKAYFVPAGEVNINADATNGMRILKIEFDAEPTVDKIEGSHFGGYTREVNPQYYGTVCLPKAGVMTGAMLFQVAYMDYKEDGSTPYKVYYDQVENGVMQAGMPYIFLAEESTIGVYYTGTAEETAKDHNGLHGTLVNITEGMNATGIYMLYNNQVVHSTNAASTLPANRAYLQISEIPGYGNPSFVAPAPKYRRISTGFNGVNTTTGMDEIEASETPMKVMIEGQIYIIRGEKMYDVTGKLVK